MTAAVEGVEGVYNNAAAPGVREPFSLKWFDYDVQAGFSFPGAYRSTDFSNRGENGDPNLINRTDNFNYYNFGAQLQFGELGVTVMGDFIQYAVSSNTNGQSLTLTLGRIHATTGYGFLNNQVVFGAGVRVAFVNISQNTSDGAVIQMAGASPQVGVVIKPNDTPFRFGATARAPVDAGNLDIGQRVPSSTSNVRQAGEFVVPDRVTQPWEIEGGFAYQIGPRPLNPAWVNPHEQQSELLDRTAAKRQSRALARSLDNARIDSSPRAPGFRAHAKELLDREEARLREDEDSEIAESKRALYAERQARYLNWPRERLLVLASLLMTGASSNAVAIEGFIDQRRELVGTRVSFAPRFAVESEPIPNLLRLRAGVYIEPSRFEDGNDRQHFTFGSDLRTFTWNLFGLVPQTTIRVSGFLDVAPRYENFGFGIGVWH